MPFSGNDAGWAAPLPPLTLTPANRSGVPSTRAKPRATRPSRSVPPKPPPSPHAVKSVSSCFHVTGHKSLPGAAVRSVAQSQVMAVMTGLGG